MLIRKVHWVCCFILHLLFNAIIFSRYTSPQQKAECWWKVDKVEINTFSSWVLQKAIEGNLDLTSMHLHRVNDSSEIEKHFDEYRNLKLLSVLDAGRTFIRSFSFHPTASKTFLLKQMNFYWHFAQYSYYTHLSLQISE